MSWENIDLESALGKLADSPAPPSTLDVGAAMLAGRTRLRRRRRSAVGATVLTMAVGAGVLAGVVPGSAERPSTTLPGLTRSSGPTESASGAPWPSNSCFPTARPSSSGTPLQKPLTGPDPLVVDAAFGWLPDWIKTIGTSYEGYSVMTSAAGTAPADAFFVQLDVLEPGSEVPFGATKLAASPVNGQPAYWIFGCGRPESDRYLVWQLPDGRWLRLLPMSYNVTAHRDIPLEQIAAGVSTGRQAVPLPFKLGALPAGVLLQGIQLKMPTAGTGGSWAVEMDFGMSGRHALRVTINPAGAPGGPDSTKSAGPNPSPSSSNVPHACKEEHQVQACVEVDTPAALAPIGGMDGFLAKLTLLGADRSSWTTEVMG